MGFGVERFDARGRLLWSSLPPGSSSDCIGQWCGFEEMTWYEYGDGTNGVPDGALKRVVLSDPYSLTRYTDFLYDSRGKLAALRDEDGYQT